MSWYSVRCLLGEAGTGLVDAHPGWLYEERIPLWQAASELASADYIGRFFATGDEIARPAE